MVPLCTHLATAFQFQVSIGFDVSGFSEVFLFDFNFLYYILLLKGEVRSKRQAPLKSGSQSLLSLGVTLK